MQGDAFGAVFCNTKPPPSTSNMSCAVPQVGPRRLRLVQNGSDWLRFPDWPQKAQIGSDWPQEVQIGPEGPEGPDWLRLAPGGSYWPQKAQIGSDWPQEAQIGPRRPRLAQTGPRRPRLAQIGPRGLRGPIKILFCACITTNNCRRRYKIQDVPRESTTSASRSSWSQPRIAGRPTRERYFCPKQHSRRGSRKHIFAKAPRGSTTFAQETSLLEAPRPHKSTKAPSGNAILAFRQQTRGVAKSRAAH